MFVVSAVSPMGPRVQGRREPVGRVTSVSHLAQVFLILGPEATLPRDTPSTPPTPRQAGMVYHPPKEEGGEGNGTPLQYSCLENPRDGGAWWAAIYGVAQSRTRLK